MKINKQDDLSLHRLADVRPEVQRGRTYGNYVWCYLLGRASVFSEMTDKALEEEKLRKRIK